MVDCEGRLRDAMVLVKIELTPVANHSPRATGRISASSLRQVCGACLLTADKDLVLPVTGSHRGGETFFVAASTDMERAEIMMKRIREQLEAGAGFKGMGILKVSATAVELPSREEGKPLAELVGVVADRITETVMLALGSKTDPEPADGHTSAASN